MVFSTRSFKKKFVLGISCLCLFSKTGSSQSNRGLDLILGIGTSLPTAGGITRKTKGQIINRFGFSYQLNNFFEEKPLGLNASLLFSRKGFVIGTSFQERWVFTMLENQWSFTWWEWKLNSISFKPSFDLVPSYNLSFHTQGSGVISTPQYLNEYQFDIGLSLLTEIGPLGSRIYYHHSFTNPSSLEDFKINHLGFELLIPLYRKKEKSKG